MTLTGHSVKIFIVKIFISVLIIIFSLQSWTKADDINDLQIEGISLNDDALEHFSKEKLDTNKGYYPKSKKIWRSLIVLENNEYNSLQIHMKLENNKYIIVGVAGLIYFFDKINSKEKCIEQRNQIIDDLKYSLKTAKLSKDEKDIVHGDKSGKSYVQSRFFDFKDDNSEYVKVACTFFTEEYSKKTGWTDYLRVGITSTELHNWLRESAYE